jgi:anaerobic magnesium-protoporphyrin IX monomethyl ester cyclase
MTDVLLTHSYFMRFDKKQWRTMQPYPPLGTMYAASVLRNAGMTVSLFDSMLAESEYQLEDYIKNLSPRIVVIYDDSFNYLTKMCLERMRIAAYRMIAIAKARGCIVAISSSDSADHVKEYLSQGADYVIKGEGETTLLELCTQVLKSTADSARGIPGLCFLESDNVIESIPRRPIKYLDSLPLPAWDLVDVENYKKHWLAANGYFSMNIVTTRGCPYGCNWCAKPIYGRGYNSRSPKNVVEEIAFLKEKYNPGHIWFCDDIFGLRPGWLVEFQKEVEQSGLIIKYKCLSRPDLLIKENTFSMLAISGCQTVWMGAESGAQKILDAMDKGTTVDQIRLATRRLRENGIRVGYFLQFGYPGESYNDILKTFELVKEEMPDEIGMSVSYPLPRTEFYNMVEKTLGTKKNWLESNDMALLFPGEFKPHFYRTLHKVLHKLHRVLRIAKGREKLTPRTILAFLYSGATLAVYHFVLQFEKTRNPNRVSLNQDTQGI